MICGSENACPFGQAFVNFSYARDRDVNYYEGGELKTRNLMTDTLRIDLVSGEATSFVSDNAGEGNITEKDKSKTALVVGLVVGGTLGILFVVGIPWFVVKKKRV